MSRSTDPLALRCHRAWTPRTEVKRPLRPAVRQQMYPPIQPMDDAAFGGRLGLAVMFVVAVMIGLLLATGGRL
jgi:hypothetical protein